MNLQAVLNSRAAAVWVLSVCRRIPPPFGVALSKRIAWLIANNPALPSVSAVRVNQYIVHGAALNAAQLDRAALDCWRNITLGFYEFFHWLERPQALHQLVDFSPAVEAVIERSQAGKHGQIVCGVHLSGFDLVLQGAYLHGLRAFVLSVPSPSAAINWQHSLRRRVGMEILDANLLTMRASLRRLEAGESLLTGIDRPIPGLKHCMNFFGRPTYLPTHHITLGLRAGVPLVLLAPLRHDDGRFEILVSEHIDLKPYSDRDKEIVCNANRVLEAAQAMIGLAPTQWAVTHPVWTQVSLPTT